MPPLAAPYVDFYAGQAAFAPNWEQAFGASAAEVNRLMLTDATWRAAIARGEVADVPRPPKQHQTIVVDRPEQDDVPPGHALWILDSRMRANTDGELHQWRFFAKPGADSITAAPVIYRRVPGDGSRIEYDVRFVGAPQPAAGGDTWLPIQSARATTWASSSPTRAPHRARRPSRTAKTTGQGSRATASPGIARAPSPTGC